MHCPRCAHLVPNGAPTCPRCGAPLAAAPSNVTPKARPQGTARPPGEPEDIASTLVWQKAGARAAPEHEMGATMGMPPGFEEEMRAAAAASGIAPSVATIVGLPQGGAPGAQPPRRPATAQPPPADSAARTLVGVGRPVSSFAPPAATAHPPPARSSHPPIAAVPSAASDGGASTLPARVLGAAAAGPEVGPVPPARAPAPRSSSPPGVVLAPRAARAPIEIGATISPGLGARKLPGVGDAPISRKKHALDKRLVVAVPKKKISSQNRAGILAIAGGAVALLAVLVVVLLPARSPLVAHPRVDADGHDGLDIECSSCADSTTLRVGATAATLVGHHAFLPIVLPLGESKLEVAMRRPGSAKDEITSVRIHMPYRVTTDLATLRGDHPAIQIVIEAQTGTQVSLDGKEVPLVAGRAIDLLDVTDACTGESDEPRTLSRQIPYVITPPGGSPEQGSVHVSTPITTLRITAPGPAVVTDKESFVLAGRTAKGVELFAGPHSIPLRADGTFAHVMNVSAVGATQIAVRAQAQGMAPRIVKIDVRRVESLDAAAREFVSKSPLTLPDLASDAKSKIGRAAMVSGFLLQSKSADQLTVMKLRGYGGPSCPPLPAGTKVEAAGDAGPCLVEVAVGAQVAFAPGDVITGCGRFAGTTGEPGNEVPQVRADFVVKGAL